MLNFRGVGVYRIRLCDLVLFLSVLVTPFAIANEKIEESSDAKNNQPLVVAQAGDVRNQRNADASPTSSAIEEVVVTARKKQESLQDVPISMSAFNSEALDSGLVTGIEEIAQQTPGLFFQSFDESRPNLYIRGVGSRQFDAGSEGSVGVFIDEFYIGRFSGIMTGLTDIERVEVLKGPQGTLYGRNTIGGAINIITKDPTNDLEAKVRLGVGNFDSVVGEASVSGALIQDKVLGRLSVSKRDRDGYVTNLTTGSDLMGDDTTSVRGKLLFTLTDELKIMLTADYNDNQREGTQGEPRVGVFAARPGIQFIRTEDRFSDFYNADSRFDRKILQLMGRVEYETEHFNIISLTGWRDSDLKEFRDLDSTRFDTVSHDTVEDSESFSQEFRISSNPSEGGKLDWIAGVYYYDEDTERLDRFPFGPDSAVSAIVAAVDAGFPPAPVFVPGTDTLNEDLIVNVSTTSFALFGQFTYSITDALNITFGLRYTNDEKEAQINGVTTRPGLPPIFANFTVDLDESWNSLDPKVTLDYRFTDDVLAYFTYSQGFKSGGFQFAQFNPAGASQVFDPEEVEVFELGAKTSWWERRLQLNGSVFFYDYTDLQLARVVLLPNGSFGNVITNAGQSSITGVEIDIRLSPIDRLRLDIGYSYLDAEYDEYIFNDVLDFSGNRMIRSPENTFNASASYSLPLWQGNLTLRGDWTWTDEFFFEADEGLTPFTRQGGYSVFDAFISYEWKEWQFRFWGKNLGDKAYRNSALNFSGSVIEFMAPPKMWGFDVTWQYN